MKRHGKRHISFSVRVFIRRPIDISGTCKNGCLFCGLCDTIVEKHDRYSALRKYKLYNKIRTGDETAEPLNPRKIPIPKRTAKLLPTVATV